MRTVTFKGSFLTGGEPQHDRSNGDWAAPNLSQLKGLDPGSEGKGGDGKSRSPSPSGPLSAEELARRKKLPCRFIAARSDCRFGDKCMYSHDKTICGVLAFATTAVVADAASAAESKDSAASDPAAEDAC